jgi:hypothetical protein
VIFLDLGNGDNILPELVRAAIPLEAVEPSRWNPAGCRPRVAVHWGDDHISLVHCESFDEAKVMARNIARRAEILAGSNAAKAEVGQS